MGLNKIKRMHYSTKETQICSPELGVATIRIWAHASPFITGAT